MSDAPLARRQFNAADQAAFAALSGDHNPLHMDAKAARRTQAGACVVHGIHLFLWALEELCRSGFPLLQMVEAKVKFTEFVHLDQPTMLRVLKADEGSLRLQLATDAGPVLTPMLRFAQERRAQPTTTMTDMPVVEVGTRPREPDFEAMATQQGQLALPRDPTIARRLFPALTDTLGTAVVCETSLLSTIVGMITPGLHSIFSELALTLLQPGDLPPGCAFQGKRADPRFRRVEVSAKGSTIAADITAFARLPPSVPPAVKEIAISVAPQEFRGRRALIIGGSRGIGAVTAKAIAAGGGTVALTYAEGRTEAEAVHGDIVSHYPASSTLLQYRVGEDPVAQMGDLNASFTHAYYFATPRIFGPSAAVYSRIRFLKFVEIYVDGFLDLAMALLARHSPKSLTLFYPSSVAVAERPKGMTEYSMAKAAGEVLCADLMRGYPGLEIAMPRLPRIRSDQTATVPPVPAAEPLDVMLPLLRKQRA
jgi:hypothetical protein